MTEKWKEKKKKERTNEKKELYMLNAGKGAAKQQYEMNWKKKKEIQYKQENFQNEKSTLGVENWHTGNSSHIILLCRSNPKREFTERKKCVN